MDDRFLRTEVILGKESMEKLRKTRVAVFGIGGVGSYAVEALVRTGIGKIVLIDYDKVDLTNINRQIIATEETVGLSKAEIMKSRVLSINPELEVETSSVKYLEETKNQFNFLAYDYIIDAVDTISSKLSLIEMSKKFAIPIISAMGAGNKLDPTRVRVSDIYETSVCPLARVMRRELRKRAIDSLKVVWSDEEPRHINLGDKDKRKATPSSLVFVPSVVGITMAYEIVKDILGKEV